MLSYPCALTLLMGLATTGYEPASPKRTADSAVMSKKPYRATVVSIFQKGGTVEVKRRSNPKKVETIFIESIYNSRGKKLSAPEGFRRLRVGATVLVSADYKKVDAQFLKDVNSDTLVLVPSPGDESPSDEPIAGDKGSTPKMKKSPAKGAPLKQVPKN